MLGSSSQELRLAETLAASKSLEVPGLAVAGRSSRRFNPAIPPSDNHRQLATDPISGIAFLETSGRREGPQTTAIHINRCKSSR